MNLDLITKLAKLANNNPNENEANLAARKVCRLLAEGEFKFVNTGQTASQVNQQQQKYPPRSQDPSMDFVYEYFRQRAKETEQNARKSERTRYPGDSKWYYERPPHEYKSPFADAYWNSPKQQKWPGNDPFKKPSEQQKEERLLKCRICKNSKLTKFVGLAELYECNTCQWTAYEAKAKGK